MQFRYYCGSGSVTELIIIIIQVMSLGLFYLEYSDAIKEGDGDRIMRCWRYLLPIFWNSGRKNYANEALIMLYQHDYALSKRHAAQLKWTRCINVHGRRGRNIPADLHLEHLNRMVKEAINGLGSNKSEQTIQRVSKALGTKVPILRNFDQDNNVPETIGEHTKPNTNRDLNTIANQLTKATVFKTMHRESTGNFLTQGMSCMEGIKRI